MAVAEVFVSLGSNIAPRRNLAAALPLLDAHLGPLRVSPVYEGPAVGFEGDPFLNLVVAFSTQDDLVAVLDFLRGIEHDFGRRRGEARFAPRSLDLDIILFGDQVGEAAGLRLPRADILRYAFVLKPLVDLAPDAIHPELGRTYRELWESLQPGPGLTEVAPLEWARPIPAQGRS